MALLHHAIVTFMCPASLLPAKQGSREAAASSEAGQGSSPKE